MVSPDETECGSAEDRSPADRQCHAGNGSPPGFSVASVLVLVRTVSELGVA
jgi:hypothetical protein